MTSERELPVPKDPAERKLIGDVRKYGWHVISVAPGDPPDDYPFAYSVGLYHSFGHPEIVVVGLPPNVAHRVINAIADDVKESSVRYVAGMTSAEYLQRYDVSFIDVDEKKYDDHLGFGIWFYRGNGFPALQCVWPSRFHAFPWEPRAEAGFLRTQPLLGRPKQSVSEPGTPAP